MNTPIQQGSAPEQDGAVVAGPSRSEPVVPTEYLVQPGNLKPSPLSGTRDLITLFGLKPMYDTFLKPYLPESVLASSTDTKGKDKVVEPTTAPSSAGGGGGGGMKITLGGKRIGEIDPNLGSFTESVKSKKPPKLDKYYSHLVQDIPGRNNIKKDHFIRDLVLNPDYQQPPRLVPLDDQSLREAFTLKPGQIPGFDALIWESNTEPPTSSKKKKKRKHDKEGGGKVGTGIGGDIAGGEEEHRRKKAKRREGAGTYGSP